MTGAICSAKLRNGDPCRSAANDGEFCAYHAALAAVDRGDEALRSELEKWKPDERATFARVLAEVG
jgi:hypothetical protein